MDAFDPGKRNTGRAQHRQALAHLPAKEEPPTPVGKFLRERKVTEGVQGIVEIDQELAPEHGIDVGALGNRGAAGIKQAAQTMNASPDQDGAAARPMKARRLSVFAGLDHIERNHSGDDAILRLKGLAQDGGIVDAILQSDDDGVFACVSRNLPGHLPCVPAFHGNQHHIRATQGRFGLGCKREGGCSDCLVASCKIGNAQAVGCYGLGQWLAEKEGYIPSGRGKSSAKIAADAAGSDDDDTSIGRYGHASGFAS